MVPGEQGQAEQGTSVVWDEEAKQNAGKKC
jgi:hypothetical protein